MLTEDKFELVCGLMAAVISVLISPGVFFCLCSTGAGRGESFIQKMGCNKNSCRQRGWQQQARLKSALKKYNFCFLDL